MKSSRRLHITPEARADVGDIRRYTAVQWDARQRDIYHERLKLAMHGLLDHPVRGRPRDELYAGCRSLLVESHVVFYYLTDDEIVIDRLLHEGQDAPGEVSR